MPDEPRIVPLTWSERRRERRRDRKQRRAWRRERRKGISGDLEDTVRHAQKRTWERNEFVNKD